MSFAHPRHKLKGARRDWYSSSYPGHQLTQTLVCTLPQTSATQKERKPRPAAQTDATRQIYRANVRKSVVILG